MTHALSPSREFVHYWDSFYLQQHHVRDPSLFARFVSEQYLQNGKSLLEIGCGNGRDAGYFKQAGMDVTGIDLSSQAIKNSAAAIPSARFIVGDFSELHLPERFHYVYSRFTLHAVDEAAERRTLASAAEHLHDHGLLLIEVRTILDELCGQGERISAKEWIHDGHYRRFIIPENILNRARKAGFSPIHVHLAKGLAPWRNEDPTVLRLVLRKEN